MSPTTTRMSRMPESERVAEQAPTHQSHEHQIPMSPTTRASMTRIAESERVVEQALTQQHPHRTLQKKQTNGMRVQRDLTQTPMSMPAPATRTTGPKRGIRTLARQAGLVPHLTKPVCTANKRNSSAQISHCISVVAGKCTTTYALEKWGIRCSQLATTALVTMEPLK